MATLPPLPPGFQLEGQGQNDGTPPPPPPGFVLEGQPWDGQNVTKLSGGPGPRQERFGEGYAGQALSGVNEGIADAVGAPAQLVNDYVVAPAMAGINAVAGTDFRPSDKPFLGQAQMREMLAPTIAPPSDDPGKQMVRRVGQEFGAAALPVAGFASKAARPVQMIAAEAGLTAGSGVGAAVAEQVAPDNPWAELAGQVLGAAGAAGLAGGARKLITPNTASPERVKAADVLKREGIEVTAGQKTGNKGLQYAESELGGAKGGDLMERQAEQFTAAALKRAGIKANRASPEVIDGAFKRIGSEFDDLARRNDMPLDYQLGSDLGDVWREYSDLVPESQQSPAIQKIITDLVNSAANSGSVPGSQYQAFRSRLDRMARGARNDPQLSDALFGLRNAMDVSGVSAPPFLMRWGSPDLRS